MAIFNTIITFFTHNLMPGILWLNDNILWGIPMIIVLLGTHIFFTFRLGIQRYIFRGIKETFKTDESNGDVSPWGSLASAMGATLGTGNIVGVALAIGLGGPGALFWCWITGVFGIATKYAESLIAIKYRIKTESGMVGGAMTAFDKGLHCKLGGVVFAVLTALATFGIGSTIQANAISDIVKEVSGGIIPFWVVGLVLAILTFLIIIGSVHSIAKVCMWFVPIMAIIYIASCLIILALGIETLPKTFALIMREAFSGKAIVGGIFGSAILTAMRWGIARGLFSNESGMGSAAILAAAGKTPNVCKQSLVSATGTFWSTVVFCLITGLVIVNTGAYQHSLEGYAITNFAFDTLPGKIGSWCLAFGLFTFAFSSIIGWFYYGETCVKYLFGQKIVMPYKMLYVISVFIGAVMSLEVVWNMADFLNALMIIPNLICVWGLTPVIVQETKKYLYSNKLDEIDEEIQ